MKPSDPAYWMLQDAFTTTPTVYDKTCYICTDPEFAQMGLPLCQECPNCIKNSNGAAKGHVPADEVECSVCGFDIQEEYYRQQTEAEQRGEVA